MPTSSRDAMVARSLMGALPLLQIAPLAACCSSRREADDGSLFSGASALRASSASWPEALHYGTWRNMR